jgi:hypothetical protein
MSRNQFILGLLVASVMGGIIALAGFKFFSSPEKVYESFEQKQNIRFSNYLNDTAVIVPEDLILFMQLKRYVLQ